MYVFKGDITFPKSDTYDIGVDADIMLNRNNCSQINAIRTALEERFTLIQGPPGMCQLPSVFLFRCSSTIIYVYHIYTVAGSTALCMFSSFSFLCVLLVKCAVIFFWKFKPGFCSFSDTEVHSTYKTETSKLHIVCLNSLLFALLLLRLASSNVKGK